MIGLRLAGRVGFPAEKWESREFNGVIEPHEAFIGPKT